MARVYHLKEAAQMLAEVRNLTTSRSAKWFGKILRSSNLKACAVEDAIAHLISISIENLIRIIFG